MRKSGVTVLLALLLFALPAAALARERPSASATFTPGGRAAAQFFRAGTRGVAVGDAYYCIEANGVYRFNGEDKALVCKGYFDVDGSIVTDGSVMYVTQTRPAGVNVLRIDVAAGVSKYFAGYGPNLSKIAGVMGGKLYLLCWNETEEWNGLDVYAVDVQSAEEELRLSHVGGAQLWKDNLILHGFRSDVGPSVYLTLDREGNTGIISHTALGARGLSDGIYYWACSPDDNGIWDWIELRRIGAEGTEAILTVNCPGSSAYGGQFLEDCATFQYASGGMTQYLVDYETGEAVDCTLPDGSIGTWFEEDGALYAYSYADGTLYRYREGKFQAAAAIGRANVLALNGGYLYYSLWEGDTSVQVKPIR